MDHLHLLNNVSDTNSSYRDWEEMGGSDNILEFIPVITDSLDGGWFGKIGTSLVLVFGTFGNMMTIIVLRQLRTGWSAMSVYLTALAISDTVMLYAVALPMWARKIINFDIYTVHVIVCKVMIWMLNTASALSAWLLVALTAQRAASVVWPHRINIVCTRQKSVAIVLVITCTWSLFYSHIVYGYQLVKLHNDTAVRCTFGSPVYQHFWVTVWVRVDMFVYAILPCAFLLMCNVILGWTLTASVKEVNQKLSSAKQDQIDRRTKRASSTTVTIIVLSTVFVVMTLPLMIYNSFVHDYAAQNTESRRLYYFVYDFFLVFGLFNFAWNFYLYCLTGTKFRKEFLKILFGCCGRSSSTRRPAPDSEGTQSPVVGTVHMDMNTEKDRTDDF